MIDFIFNPSEIVMILIPLKLFSAKQNFTINCIANGKLIAFTGENNHKGVQQAIAY